MDILFSIIGLGLLVLGAEIIIRGSVSFGRKINISLFAIGVVIVAGGTSLPELASSKRKKYSKSKYWKLCPIYPD